MNDHDNDLLHARIRELEDEIQAAKSQWESKEEVEGRGRQPGDAADQDVEPVFQPRAMLVNSSLHNLMLLSDSALPLGSFAYSSGLESFLAHHKVAGTKETNLKLFHKFLRLSIQSMAYTNIPYALAAFRDPSILASLDNDLDASTPCNVARRASIAQGRALLSVWERAFSMSAKVPVGGNTGNARVGAITILEGFARELKISSISSNSVIPTVNGHIAPLWGTICLCLGLSLSDSAYLFLLNHTKAVVSAAVRASVMGPYMAQSVLASRDLQELIGSCLQKVWWLDTENAGQVIPMLDLWVGRHELLYSRIFNS